MKKTDRKINPRSVLKILLVIFCAVFAVSAVYLGSDLLDRQTGNREYEDLADTALQIDGEPTMLERWDRLMPDFASLEQTNSDFLCWIEIPDTVVSYPVVQGSDNDRYLYYTFTNQHSYVGCLFFDVRCNASLEGRAYNIIHGHRRNDGSMFGGLYKYASQSYYDAHRTIYIYTPDGMYTYEVFAAYESSIESQTFVFRITTAEEMNAFIEYQLATSPRATEFDYTGNENVIALSTCMKNSDYSTRFVVFARQTGFVAYPESYWVND